VSLFHLQYLDFGAYGHTKQQMHVKYVHLDVSAGCTAILQGTFLHGAEGMHAYVYQLSWLMKLSPQKLYFP